MVLDDDGVAEAMLHEDPSLRAGPGGFRTPYSSFFLVNRRLISSRRCDRSYTYLRCLHQFILTMIQ